MNGHADLFAITFPPVVPEQPAPAVEDRERLVDGIGVPLSRAGADNGVGGMPVPAGDAILGPGQADLGVVLIAEADIEHHIPFALLDHLATGHAVLLPGVLGLGPEDRVLVVPRPLQAVRTG